MYAASKAVFPKGRLAKDGPKKLAYSAAAASFAHRLDRCENLGLTSTECENVDTSLNLIFVVEYQKQYLHLHLLEVDPTNEVFPSFHDKLATRFGEENGRDLREEIGVEDYTAKLRDFFNSFIEEAMSMYKIPVRKEHIKAIVAAGEASSPAFAEVLRVAHRAVDNEKVRVVDTIDPALVVAHGAAMYARDTELYRHRWGYRNDDEHEHNEL